MSKFAHLELIPGAGNVGRHCVRPHPNQLVCPAVQRRQTFVKGNGVEPFLGTKIRITSGNAKREICETLGKSRQRGSTTKSVFRHEQIRSPKSWLLSMLLESMISWELRLQSLAMCNFEVAATRVSEPRPQVPREFDLTWVQELLLHFCLPHAESLQKGIHFRNMVRLLWCALGQRTESSPNPSK